MIKINETLCKLLFTNGFAWNKVIYFRDESYNNIINVNHEDIHIHQQEELIELCNNRFLGLTLYVIIYTLDTILSLFNSRHTGFEKEAYENETFIGYIYNRESFAWINLIFKTKRDMGTMVILKRMISTTLLIAFTITISLTLKFKINNIMELLHNISLSLIIGLFIAILYETIYKFTS